MSATEIDDGIVTLQVGEQRFVTTPETLTRESGFFSALLSSRWDNKQPDGSYFIDVDPELFKHILRYLRRRILPIFYDKCKGHDHALYIALLEEAKYFLIPRLEKWLDERRYLQAVSVRYSTLAHGLILDKVEQRVEGDVELLYIATARFNTQMLVIQKKTTIDESLCHEWVQEGVENAKGLYDL